MRGFVSGWIVRCVLILSVMLAFVPSASAQTPTVEVGKPFTLTATHDGLNTDGYRLYIDGVKVGTDIPKSALVSGVVTLTPLTVSTRGSHTVQIEAFNADAATKSAPLAFTAVSAAPSAPSGLKITIVVSVADNGQIQVKVDGVEVVR